MSTMQDSAPVAEPELLIVRRQALSSVIAVLLRSVAGRAIQFVGTILLARMLGTSDFGVLAFGLTVLALSTFAADLGLGASLVRRRKAVERHDLETLLFVQLLFAGLVLVCAAAIGTVFGRVGVLTAIMIAGLPLLVVRAPAAVLMERALNFRRIAVAEVCDVATFFAVAVSGVALGGGVWSVACAGAVRPILGTLVIQRGCEMKRLRPRLDLRHVRSLFHFGARYQAAGLLNLSRDQGLNLLVAAAAGATVLGLWSLAFRILQVPFLLFTSLWRISFPAMARVIQAGGDARRLVEGAAAGVAFGTGLMLVPLMAAGPALVTGIVGRQWYAAAPALLPGAIGLLFSGPVSVSSAGLLYALGDSVTSLWAIGVETIVWWGAALALLQPLGVLGVGVGWLLAASFESAIFARAVRRRTGAALFRSMGWIPGLATIIGVVGWFAARSLAEGLPEAFCAALAGEAVFVSAVAVAHPAAMKTLLRIGLARFQAPLAAVARS